MAITTYIKNRPNGRFFEIQNQKQQQKANCSHGNQTELLEQIEGHRSTKQKTTRAGVAVTVLQAVFSLRY